MNQYSFSANKEQSDLVAQRQKKRNRILGLVLVIFAVGVIILTFFVYGDYN